MIRVDLEADEWIAAREALIERRRRLSESVAAFRSVPQNEVTKLAIEYADRQRETVDRAIRRFER